MSRLVQEDYEKMFQEVTAIISIKILDMLDQYPDVAHVTWKKLGGKREFAARLNEEVIALIRRNPGQERRLVESMEIVELIERPGVPAYRACLVFHAVGRAGLLPSRSGEPRGILDWGAFRRRTDGSAQVQIDRTGAILYLPRATRNDRVEADSPAGGSPKNLGSRQ